VLAVAFRPDGQQLAASCLDGNIAIWDVKRGTQVATIDGRRDAAGGRKHNDVMTAKRNSSSKHFTTLCWSADGESILAGGRTKYICLYAVGPKLLLRKWQISHNRSHDGVLDKLNSKQLGEGGRALSDIVQDDPDAEGNAARVMVDESLPGVKKGDADSSRKVMLEVRSKAVQFSPTGRAFAVASTDGLLVYALDETLVFDPFELGEDVTIEAAESALEEGAFGRALLLSLHLNETALIVKVLEGVQPDLVPLLVSAAVPLSLLQRLLDIVSAKLSPSSESSSPHLEFYLTWALSLLQVHSRGLRERSSYFSGSLRNVQRALLAQRDSLAKLVESNRYMLEFLCSMEAFAPAEEEEANSAGWVDEDDENDGAKQEAEGEAASTAQAPTSAQKKQATTAAAEDEEENEESWLGPNSLSAFPADEPEPVKADSSAAKGGSGKKQKARK
jgi:periodic tryptophan protein 2